MGQSEVRMRRTAFSLFLACMFPRTGQHRKHCVSCQKARTTTRCLVVHGSTKVAMRRGQSPRHLSRLAKRKIPFNSVGHLYHQMETNCEGDKVSYTVGQRIKGVVQGLSRVAWSCLGSFTVKG